MNRKKASKLVDILIKKGINTPEQLEKWFEEVEDAKADFLKDYPNLKEIYEKSEAEKKASKKITTEAEKKGLTKDEDGWNVLVETPSEEKPKDSKEEQTSKESDAEEVETKKEVKKPSEKTTEKVTESTDVEETFEQVFSAYSDKLDAFNNHRAKKLAPAIDTIIKSLAASFLDYSYEVENFKLGETLEVKKQRISMVKSDADFVKVKGVLNFYKDGKIVMGLVNHNGLYQYIIPGTQIREAGSMFPILKDIVEFIREMDIIHNHEDRMKEMDSFLNKK